MMTNPPFSPYLKATSAFAADLSCGKTIFDRILLPM